MSTENLRFIIPNPSRKTLITLILLITLLSLLSYHHATHSNHPPSLPTTTTISAAAAPISDESFPHSLSLPQVPTCAANFTDYCPCEDTNRQRLIIPRNGAHHERHCPGPLERARCRIPGPNGYRAPVPWPESRRWIWFANVPSKRLSVAKADQNWVTVDGDRLVFPGGGTSFTGGVQWYAAEMAKLVPLATGAIRTVLDVGCGVASFGSHLLDYNILTMSVAPRNDGHEAQVQFALERGLPAMLAVLGVHKLPYPSRSFDMAHCARCLIHWANRDGLYLMEIDRILRPGGYWVLSGPPIGWKVRHKGWMKAPQDLKAEQSAIENLARRLCWKKIVENATIAVWQKPTNHIHCTRKSKIMKSPPFCTGVDLDNVWNKKMENCITPLPDVETIKDTSGGSLERWPNRLVVVPPRVTQGISDGISAEIFTHDKQMWERRVIHYQYYLKSLPEGKYRNIMDMNADMGGFATALSKYPSWVMNVVPVDVANNTLGIIYERGLIGTYMDWCEAFSTYPRTYDLIHAYGIFSMYLNKCDVFDILLEMDRILRPEGAVIIGDHVDVIVKVKKLADRLQWRSRIVDSENGAFHSEKFLIVDNSIWRQTMNKSTRSQEA